jgi:hypothetical protein
MCLLALCIGTLIGLPARFLGRSHSE